LQTPGLDFSAMFTSPTDAENLFIAVMAGVMSGTTWTPEELFLDDDLAGIREVHDRHVTEGRLAGKETRQDASSGRSAFDITKRR